MDSTNSRIAQVYGYAVCLITVIVMLISIRGVVDSLIDLSDPIRAESGGYGRLGGPLGNFELYKLEVRRQPRGPTRVGPASSGPDIDTMSDAELKRLFDAEREQAIANVHFRATRSLIGNLLLIVLASVLFVVHWRWLRARDVASSAAV
jgi:hypothetical protein